MTIPTDDFRTTLGIQTRFIYPFFFDRGAADRVASRLQGSLLWDRRGVWQPGGRKAHYEEETLPHVARFLFPDGRGKGTYLVVSAADLAWIFGDGLVFERTQGRKLFARHAQVELFLNDHGIGVLSLTLGLDDGPTTAEALAFNNHLVQPRLKFPFGLRLPHPDSEPGRFANLSEEERKIAPPPDQARLSERIGRRGGRFWLSELIPGLLEPALAEGLLGAITADLAQSQLWVYSVVRFPDAVDWNDAGTRRTLGRVLSSLTQIEGSGHAGAFDDHIGVPNAVLDSRHWAAVGLMGAAHLVADQPDHHPFNPERMGRAMGKYFVPYLIVLLQRLVIQRALSETAQCIATTGAPEKLAVLRQNLLEFGAGGHFVQVSARHAVQRFFAVAEEGFSIGKSWRAIRESIDDLHAKFSAEQERRLALETRQLADDQGKATRELVKLQATIHWIEVFVVSVYAAELWHLFAEDTEFLHEHHLVSPGVILFSLLGFIGAAIVLKPWKHTGRHASRDGKQDRSGGH